MLTFLLSCALGFGFLGLLPKSLNSTVKLLICPAVGLLLFGELLVLYAFVFGLGISCILISLLTEGILSFAAFGNFGPKFKIEPVSVLFTITTIVVALIASYIYFFGLLHPTASGGLQTGGGGLYGDTALHLAYTARLETGEFPPQNPLYAGKILVYPFANDLLSAALRIGAMGINFAFILPQITFLVAFVTLFYAFCRKFTTEAGFLISFLLFSFGWGIGFVYFFGAYFDDNGFNLVTDYTNNPQFNLHFHNVFTGLIFPERSFLPGLFVALWIFLNFWEYLQTKGVRYLLVNSILVGILPFWHTHTFIFVSVSAAVFFFYLLAKDLTNAGKIIILPFLSLLLSAPFIILFLNNHSAESFLRITSGWQNGNENVISFWLRNSFLILPLAALGFWKLKNEMKIFFIGPIIAFALANIVIFQPWSWDNIKLLTLSFLFFAILSGVFLSYIYERGRFSKIVVVIVVVASSASGILSIALQLSRYYVIYDKSDIELANWAKKNTNVDEIFLIDPVPNHPIPALAGRLVYVGYPGHLWVHGINYSDREELSRKVIDGNLDLVRDAEVPISYIVLTKTAFANQDSSFAQSYGNDKYVVLDAN